MVVYICTVDHNGRPSVTLKEDHRYTTLDDADRIGTLETFSTDVVSNTTVFRTKDERLVKAVCDAFKIGIVCGRAPDDARDWIAKAFEIGRVAGSDSRPPSST